MLISNETIYNTADIERIFDYAIVNSTATSATIPRSVVFLSITYSTGGQVHAKYDPGDRSLELLLPRKSHLKESSALENLATAALEIPGTNTVDDDYCFWAPGRVRQGILVSLLSALNRRGRSYLTTSVVIPLRYCNRLRRGQLGAQKLGSYRFRLESNLAHIERLKKHNDALRQYIDDAEEWFKRHKRAPIS